MNSLPGEKSGWRDWRRLEGNDGEIMGSSISTALASSGIGGVVL